MPVSRRIGREREFWEEKSEEIKKIDINSNKKSWRDSVAPDVGAHLSVQLFGARRPEDAAIRVRVADEAQRDEEDSRANVTRPPFQKESDNVEPHEEGLLDEKHGMNPVLRNQKHRYQPL